MLKILTILGILTVKPFLSFFLAKLNFSLVCQKFQIYALSCLFQNVRKKLQLVLFSREKAIKTWLCFRINGNRSTDDRVALAELPFPFMSWSQARSRQNYPQINNCPSCGIKSLEENLYFILKSINSP